MVVVRESDRQTGGGRCLRRKNGDTGQPVPRSSLHRGEDLYNGGTDMESLVCRESGGYEETGRWNEIRSPYL